MYEFHPKMSPEEFAELINNSSDYRDYVFQALYVIQRSVDRVIPMADGDYTVIINVPENLSHLLDGGPIADLEQEPLEQSA